MPTEDNVDVSSPAQKPGREGWLVWLGGPFQAIPSVAYNEGSTRFYKQQNTTAMRVPCMLYMRSCFAG
jgi:hypothetical protein